ncbi:MAG: flippase-like domain-containing protein [Planctomycetia bacterium]|nr:flippase-like domain-containing protein [Planctomycetia bacterium]
MEAIESNPVAAKRFALPPWLTMVLRLAATATLMAYALSGIDWHDKDVDGRVKAGMWTVMAKADWSWWTLGLVTGLLVQVVAGIRWAELARPLGFDFPRRFFVLQFFEGMFFNLCLPSSIGGDVVKAYRIGETTPRRLLAGCSVVADRLTGLSALAVLGGAALAARKYALGLPATLVVATALLALALAVFLVVVSFLDRLIAAFPAPHPARGFLAQLLPYQQRPSLIAKAVAWSFVVQMGGAVAVAFSGRALGVDQPLSLWFSVVPLVALAMVLPISIGGFGVRENAMSYLLAEQGVPGAQGVAIALLWGLSTVLTGMVGGVLLLIDRSRRAAAGSGDEIPR